MCEAHTRSCFSSGLRATLQTNRAKEAGRHDSHSLGQLVHVAQNTMNNNNTSNNKVTNNSAKDNKYSLLVNYLVDTVLSIFYGLPHFILTRTL